MAEERLGDKLERLDKEVAAWARVTRDKLRMRLATLGLHDRIRLEEEKSLQQSLAYSITRKNFEIERVAFRFLRHGIFLEHGVGRGRPVGSAKARQSAKPWLAPTLPKEIDTLAQMLSDEYADIIAADLRFLIPGIIDTTISK